jgi:excisionase family DNA binding protein
MNKHHPDGKRRQRRAPGRASLGDRLFDPPDKFCERTALSRATVWRMMRDGRLRYVKFGRVRRIPTSEYERLASETA